jgi:hypothetical protein
LHSYSATTRLASFATAIWVISHSDFVQLSPAQLNFRQRKASHKNTDANRRNVNASRVQLDTDERQVGQGGNIQDTGGLPAENTAESENSGHHHDKSMQSVRVVIESLHSDLPQNGRVRLRADVDIGGHLLMIGIDLAKGVF